MAKIRIVLFSILLLGLFPLAGLAQQVVVFPPAELPTPAAPIGVGNAATGGQALTLAIDTGALAAPMDFFLGIFAPSVSPEIFLFNAGGGLQPLSQGGLVPWRSSVGSATGTLITALPTTALPAGIYHLILAAAPAGTGAISTLWQTYFGASPVAGNVRVASVPLTGLEAGVTTTATGTGNIVVVLDTGEYAAAQTFIGLTAGVAVAHIHTGLAGAIGPPFVTFVGPLGVTSGTWSAPLGSILTPDQVTAFLNDGLYFQVHSDPPGFPAGELRGQIIP